MWIESHQSLARHPKTFRLMRELDIGKPATLGHLHLLWWWALDFADNGNLRRFSDAEIAEAAEWGGEAERFVAALVTAGWVDARNRRLHDWMDYAGKLLAKRTSDAARKRQSRTSDGSPKDVHGTSDGHPPDGAGTVPDLTVPTVPNSTEPTNTLGPPAAPNGRERKLTPEEKRERDALKDVLVEVCSWDMESMTKSAWGEVEAAAKQLHAASASPPLIRGFHEQWEATYPTVGPLRPQTVASHWPEYMGGALKREEPSRGRR